MMTAFSIDMRTPFIAAARVKLERNVITATHVAAVQRALEPPIEQLTELMRSIGASTQTPIAATLPVDAVETVMERIPHTVATEHELGMAQHKTAKLLRPADPSREIFVKRPEKTVLAITLASQQGISSVEQQLTPFKVRYITDPATAWLEIVEHAVVDAGDPSAPALYVRGTTVPMLKPITASDDEERAKQIIDLFRSAGNRFGAHGSTLHYSGPDLGLFDALKPKCDRLGIQLDLVTLAGITNPPWALAAGTAMWAIKEQSL